MADAETAAPSTRPATPPVVVPAAAAPDSERPTAVDVELPSVAAAATPPPLVPQPPAIGSTTTVTAVGRFNLSNAPMPLIAIAAAAWLVAAAIPLRHAQPIDALVVLCFVPALVLLLALRRRRSTVPTHQLAIRMLFAWTVVFPIAIVAALIGVAVFSVLFRFTLGLVLPPAAEQFVVSYGVFVCIVLAGETAKASVQFWFDRVDAVTEAHFYPCYGSALALGEGTAEVYYLVLFIRWLIDAVNGSTGDGSPASSPSASPSSVVSPALFVLILVVCVSFLIPMQLLSSYHVGLALARFRLMQPSMASMAGVLVIAVVARSAFMWAFIVGTFQLPGIVLPVLLSLGIFVGYLWLVKRCEQNMPSSYLRAAGHMHFLGYGALPQDEDEASAAAANHHDAHHEDDPYDDADNVPHPGAAAHGGTRAQGRSASQDSL